MTATNAATTAEQPAGTQRPTGAVSLRRILEAARSTDAAPAYYRSVIDLLAEGFRSPCAALYVRINAQVIQHEAPVDADETDFFKPSLLAFLTDALAEDEPLARLFSPRGGGSKVAFLAAPLRSSDGSQSGAVALVMTAATEAALPQLLGQLAAAVEFAVAATALVGPRTAPGGPSAAAGQTLSNAAQYESPEELAFAVTNNLRNKIGCQQAALGLVEGRKVRIISISGLDHVAEHSTGVRVLQAAMEECLDAGRALVCQPPGSWNDETLAIGYRLHEHWSAAVQGDAVASLPLRCGDRTVAVLSLRQRREDPFTAARLEEIRARVEPYAAALILLHRARRGLVGHALDSLRGAREAVTRPGRWGVKAAAALAVCFATWFACGTLPGTLIVPATVAPAELRHITAPFDGTLVGEAALEGQSVRAGDVLCRLDQRELVQQQAELLAELTVLQRQEDRALANNQPVERQLALASQRLAQARLSVVEARLAQAEVRAPIDGVVVAGDLRKRIGGPVTRGEPLFQVAPADRWILQIQVPDADADDVSAGLSGRFAAHARPEEAQVFRISRLRPAAEPLDQHNVVIAEAEGAASAPWLRPGMEGVAKIDLGRRRVWWLALHRLLDYLHLHVWL